MPELPEVETIKRVIEPQISGYKITDIVINRSEIIAHPNAEEFYKNTIGQNIKGMSRQGKFLIIHLKNGSRIIIHLRMTGCLLVTLADYPMEKHTHIIFHLSSGNELRFSDTRRFGRFWLIEKEAEDIYSGIHKLGLEPFDERLTAQYLFAHFGKRRKSIKECLLDQSVLAGIGNIYSDEILYCAKLNPSRPANSLTFDEWEHIADIIPELLLYFVDKNQISAEDYLDAKGKDYRNTPFLQVYRHNGEPCPNCGDTLCRTVIGGRSCVYCPVCQE